MNKDITNLHAAIFGKTTAKSNTQVNTNTPKTILPVKGEQGPKGEDGIAGPKGDTGDKGDEGPQGIQGEQGRHGNTGWPGAKGDKGDEGPQGIQGPKGDKGDIGPEGKQGLKGDKGDTGPQGIQGERGLTGPKGEAGEVIYAPKEEESRTGIFGGGGTHFHLKNQTTSGNSIIFASKQRAAHLKSITAGSNVSITDDGAGQLTINSAASGGTVTTTGAPASGNIAAFSGATSITSSNLSGDVTTAGTLATTVASIQGSPVLITSPVKNQALLFNGTDWVNAAQGTSFTFSIASFTCNAGGSGTVIEIGTGTWKAIGALSFSATYNNGPATGGFVSHTGWSNLTLTGGSFLGPTTNTTADNFPSVGSSLSYTLHATDGSATPTSTITYFFFNDNYFGTTTTTSGYTSSDVTGLANKYLTNSRADSFSVSPGAGAYILWASPTRLGAVSFTVGGFAGGFGSPATVSVTNASGFTENYNVYRSINPNLGAVSVVTS